jgi:hypothetical protein
MKKKAWLTGVLFVLLLSSPLLMRGGGPHDALKPEFQTSDRCLACHNGIATHKGEDISIGLDWRSSSMANSSRDPYWQASVRREVTDHPEHRALAEDECSICHMPITRYEARDAGNNGEIFAHLPFDPKKKDNAKAEDGVTCSVCHQIGPDKLGTKESFNGGFVVNAPKEPNNRPEYGPYPIDEGRQRIMESSTGGFRPQEGTQVLNSELCATCHTLLTTPVSKSGRQLGLFPEQMPYKEWLHSDYAKTTTCQGCHMPEIAEPVAIAAVLGQPRPWLRRHTFVGANFFMQRMFSQYRQELSVAATNKELMAGADHTIEFLQGQSARVTVPAMEAAGDRLAIDVKVENLTGHKLPTAYPSRRAWLHVVVTDRGGKTVFESGALNPDGSIQGNDNDADGTKFEPFYREITSPDQVQIYEPILQDEDGQVTTGLLKAVRYCKDSRLLPAGFDKATADQDIYVVGDAAADPGFTGGGDLVRYTVPLQGAQGPYHVKAELWYQPIGFRWAHNLDPYKSFEPQRFLRYYDSMASGNAVVLAKAEATR